MVDELASPRIPPDTFLHAELKAVAGTSPRFDATIARALYVTVHGSRAYGLATDNSDTDLKGIVVPPSERLYGFVKAPAEQLEFAPNGSRGPGRIAPFDTVLFALTKFFRLASEGNPNALEILFTDEADVRLLTPLGRRLRDLGPSFLSRRIRQTFGVYARGQLKRIAVHRRWLLQPPDHPPTRAEFGLPETSLLSADQRGAIQALIQQRIAAWEIDWEPLLPHQRLAIQGQIERYLVDIADALGVTEENGTTRVREVAAARQLGLDDNFLELLARERRYQEAQRTWQQYQAWRTNRNFQRSALERAYGYDTKHGAHLWRLHTMAYEALATGHLRVRCPNRDEVLAIKNGAWSYDELVERAQRIEDEMDALLRSGRSPLPDHPDVSLLQRACVAITAEALQTGRYVPDSLWL